MKPMNHCLISAAAGLLFTGSAALAQLNSTLHGAMNAPGGVAGRPMGAMNGPAVGATGAVPGPGAAASMQDMRNAEVVAGTPAAAGVDSNPGARSRSLAAHMSVTASAALDMTDTIRAINSATLEARQSLVSDINARIEASDHAMAELSERAKTLRAGAQADFKVAVKEAQAKERALRKSVKAATRAKADVWGAARADLAAHYDAYAEAVAHAEAVASVSERTAHTADHEDPAMPMTSADSHARDQASVTANR